MVDRINLLLKAKNITARQFAEEIGIQPSGMSHILSGRNNPSLDFVMKVIRRWPEVNINWLMFGKGEMYAGVPLNVMEHEAYSGQPAVPEQGAEQYDLFSPQEPVVQPEAREGRTVEPSLPPLPAERTVEEAAPEKPITPAAVTVPPAQPNVVRQAVESEPLAQPAENSVEATQPTSTVVQPTQKKKKVVKMIVMYDDHSFAEYYPE